MRVGKLLPFEGHAQGEWEEDGKNELFAITPWKC